MDKCYNGDYKGNWISEGENMIFFVIAVLVIGLAGMIGNQYSMLRKMEGIEEILREIRDKN